MLDGKGSAPEYVTDRVLQPDLAEIDAGAELGRDRFAAAARQDLDHIRPRALAQPIKFEIAEIIARGLGDDAAILQQAHARALDAIDHAVGFRRDRPADEARRVAPEVAVIDARPRAEFRIHHLETLLARQRSHLVVLELDRPHGAGRAGLCPAGLVPALVEEVGVERPSLRHLVLLVPPDVAVRAGVHQVFSPFGFFRVDEDDPVGPLGDRAAAPGHARRIVAVIAHGGQVGDVDHRHLPALLLPDVDPPVAVLRHRLRVAGPLVADILIHGGERAQVAVGACGDVDDHVPFFHSIALRSLAPAPPLAPPRRRALARRVRGGKGFSRITRPLTPTLSPPEGFAQRTYFRREG